MSTSLIGVTVTYREEQGRGRPTRERPGVVVAVWLGADDRPALLIQIANGGLVPMPAHQCTVVLVGGGE